MSSQNWLLWMWGAWNQPHFESSLTRSNIWQCRCDWWKNNFKSLLILNNSYSVKNGELVTISRIFRCEETRWNLGHGLSQTMTRKFSLELAFWGVSGYSQQQCLLKLFSSMGDKTKYSYYEALSFLKHTFSLLSTIFCFSLASFACI